MLINIFKQSIEKIQENIFNYNAEKLEPSDWVEKNIYLTKAESNYAGYFNYNVSPYSREIIDCLSPSSDVEMIAVMKCAQSGLTAGVITAIIPYIISECPSNILFLSGNDTLVQNTVRDRLDPIIYNSGLSKLLMPNVNKKRNQKTGDTDFKKEFAGGSLTALTYKPSNLRFYSAKYILADEFDDAPRSDKKEGSIRSLLENRTKSFGSSKKLCYVSTPTTSGASNIEEVYELGDKRKRHWECPHCKEWIAIEWRVDREDGTFGGIKYKLDEKNELIESSVHYECQNCSGEITYQMKYDLDLKGKWAPTVEPKRPNYRSYLINALIIPVGFDSWVDLVYQWIDANYPTINESKLKAFMNTQLGLPWKDLGAAPRVNELMNNERNYEVGIVPNITAEKDGNGKIVLLTLCCDLGGIMSDTVEDVRLDYEIIAHSSTGATYHIDHGNIGTFKRGREKTDLERKKDSNRTRWTYNLNQKHNVWDELKKLIYKSYPSENDDFFDIDITIIDSGYFTKLAYSFIRSIDDRLVYGIKGVEEPDYRAANRDTALIFPSKELVGKGYNLYVNPLKDILHHNMKLKKGIDGYQPSGFMNFPQPSGGKYTMKSYFIHYEGEHRVEVKKNDVIVGYAWRKKHNNALNHYFDTAVYSIAAREIYIDFLRRSDSRNAKLTWDDFVSLIK